MCRFFNEMEANKSVTALCSFVITIMQLSYMYLKHTNIQHLPREGTIETKQLVAASLENEALTPNEQATLTPDAVIGLLRKGNKDFSEDALTVRNNTACIRKSALSQYPKAVVLSCMDSRVPVEDVFHRGIGDLFVLRIAGNFINDDILGSLEYACKVSCAKLIVVMGHEHCGAIRSIIDEVEIGFITSMLSNIRPALDKAKETFKGRKCSSNAAFVNKVCICNIENSVQKIRDRSSILKEMEDKGEIKIVGAFYHMKTGKIAFLKEKTKKRQRLLP